MRKFLLTALSCLAFCFALAQETATIDGIKYSLYSNGEAAISHQSSSLAGDIIIPEKVSYNGTDYTVTSVRNEAFMRVGMTNGIITSIVLPNSITSLGERCFENCSSLTSITLPEGITSLGWSCFYGCSSLESINLPESITSLGERCFEDCSSLKSITLPDGITSLDERFFYNCSSLVSINLPESITSLGESCFAYCSSLVSINLPKGITSLGERCFEDCSSLESIILPEGITSLGESCFNGCSSLVSINLPEGITSLGGSCFSGCSSLESITLPDGITSLTGCFSNCSSLASVTLPDGITYLYGCFSGCSSLESITLPNSITSLGGGCFQDCSSLKSITLPDGITSLDDCFDGCTSLESVILPDGITSLGDYCFEDCSSLESITLPDGITHFGFCCFNGCSSLTSLVVPKSLRSIGFPSGCFGGCDNMISITFKWEKSEDILNISAHLFNKKNITLYVPVGTKELYEEIYTGFKRIEEIDFSGETEKCATPVINYADGKLVFTCATEGAEYYYTITDEDIKKDAHSQDGTVELTAAYNISVYASADGYISSDEAKAVLYFIKAGSGTGVGVSEIFAEERGVVLSTDGQTVTASGLADGEAVSLYTTDGMLLSTSKASADGIATLDTKGERGVLIVKVGNDGLKIAVN